MSDKARQVWGLVFGLPIGFAIGISVLMFVMQLQGGYRIGAIAILLAVGISVLLWASLRNAKGSRQVEALLDILYKEADPEKFIAASLEALKKAKHRTLKSTLTLNLAVGYTANGQYEDAIRTMKEMNVSLADKVSKAMYYLNAAACYAEKGAATEALEAYSLAKPLLEKTEKDMPAGHIYLTRGLLYFVEEKYQDALETFERARSRGFDDRHTMTKLQLFEARAYKQIGKTKEARALYGKILQKKTYPFLLQKAKEELAALDNPAEN